MLTIMTVASLFLLIAFAGILMTWVYDAFVEPYLPDDWK